MKRQITAAELMAQLQADPDYVKRRKEKEEKRRQLEAEYAKAEAPLVEELRAAGVDVDSAWQLIPPDCRVRTPAPYPEALPILLRHLSKEYPDAVLAGIAGALAVPEAKPAWDELVRQYRLHQETRTKDTLASTLATIADAELLGELIALAKDRSLGPSRVMLLSALESSNTPEAAEALQSLSSDPELKKEIKAIRRRQKRA